ncbi:MAG: type II toxin-antitoxin system VapC family toxin [Euryarchaeota archaeon]|nr:type II toxin-antitoxin system VapC family toxin [Euryarchaeota archaeon]
MAEYFYDSYAIIEYLRGNRAFQKYFKEPRGVTTRFNLIEVYCRLLDDPDFAEEVYSSFSSVLVDPTDGQLKRAMVMRRELKGKGLNISYADAIGYLVARDRKARFLTGDNEFKDVPHVEFVK